VSEAQAAAVSARPLGMWSAMALVIGNIIGAGLFLLPSSLAKFGGASSLGWTVSFAGAMVLAVVFARLAAHYPRAGGPYAYTRLAFGETAGFLMAWSYWISCWCAVAAIAVALTGSLGDLFPFLIATPARRAASALAALWLATAVNLVGVRAAGSAQVTTVVLKVLPLLVIGLAALPHIEPARLLPPPDMTESWWSVAAATAALTLWAFQGLESATIPAEQVSDAGRLVPRATLIGTALACLVTVFACSAVLGLIEPSRLESSTAPFADAGRFLWGEWGGRLFAAVAAISCLGALNGWVLCQGHIPAAAARDGLFPAALAASAPGQPPRLAIIVSTALASLLVLANFTGSLVSLFTASVLLSTAATLLPYLMSAAAALRLHRQLGRGARARAFLAAAAGALVFSAWAFVGTGDRELVWFAGLMLVGLAVHVARRLIGGRPVSPAPR
jgi:basic amino acid/polyamine antiporter, APA family